MGWDAFADIKGERFYDDMTLGNEYQNRIFLNAFNNAKRFNGEAPEYLKVGVLEGRMCASIIYDALQFYKEPLHAYNERWTAEQVRQVNKHAFWIAPKDRNERYYYYATKYFIKACAKAGVGIRFSY